MRPLPLTKPLPGPEGFNQFHATTAIITMTTAMAAQINNLFKCLFFVFFGADPTVGDVGGAACGVGEMAGVAAGAVGVAGRMAGPAGGVIGAAD
jgi:hypothetical protein